MRHLVPLAAAQVEAEVKRRLRSTGTLVAILALVVLSFMWIPDPRKNWTSISWRGAGGAITSGIYNSAYVGAASALLASLFLAIIGFYLVAGSVRRDAETRVGAILASTPISRTAYLAGKLAAHLVYLQVVAACALASGVLVFLRYGTGPFEPGAFLVPHLLLVPPSLVTTAALALLFDVTPGLRGRGGLIVYFFVFAFLFMALPGLLHGGMAQDRGVRGFPIYDPTGAIGVMQIVRSTLPEGSGGSISMGLQLHDEPVRRVVWRGLPVTGGWVAARAVALGLALVPLVLAVLLFDRFDPARARPRLRARRTAASAIEAIERPAAPIRPLPPVSTHPTAAGAIAAEARLIWEMVGWLRWPLLAAAVLAAVLPGAGTRVATAAFLLLLAPALSEVAAREHLHGTRALVFSQPAVPRSPVGWKAAAAALFALALGAPAILRAALASPARGFAFATGLLFVAGFAAGAGAVTRGRQLFSGVYVALWYAAVSGAGPLDFSGAFGGGLGAAARLAWVAAGAGAVGLALAAERWRGARGG